MSTQVERRAARRRRIAREALIRGLFETYLEAGIWLPMAKVARAVSQRLGYRISRDTVATALRRAGYDTSRRAA